MPPEIYTETMLLPNKRKLIRITFKDAEKAEEIIQNLM
jgi:DNA gyrase/topoisomerase IV subunit B